MKNVPCEQSFKELCSLRSTVEIHCSSESHKEQSAIFPRPEVSSYPSWHFNLDILQRGLERLRAKYRVEWYHGKCRLFEKCTNSNWLSNAENVEYLMPPRSFFTFSSNADSLCGKIWKKSFILYTVRQIPCTLWIAQVY